MKKSTASLPEGVQKLVEEGIRRVNPEKVYLFGSRARSDERSDSDFDLAFLFKPDRQAEWSRFLADAEDSTLTLRRIDWINFDEASDELRHQIELEGRVIYEKAGVRLG